MKRHPLSIIEIEHSEPPRKPDKISKRREVEGHFETLWRTDPQMFNPLRNAKERERINRSLDFLEPKKSHDKIKAVDVGCGEGVFAKRLLEKEGYEVLGVDCANIALKKLMDHYNGDLLTAKNDCMPNTTLEDDAFDLVISLDLLAYLKPDEYRLFFNEIARIMKKDAKALISTPIDFRSENALQKFIELAKTELEIEKMELSHFSYYIKLKDIFRAPKRFYESSKSPLIRKKALSSRSGLLKKWFQLNSTSFLAPIWKLISFATTPIASSIDQNHWLLLKLEKLAKFLNSENTVSHAIILAKRKLLFDEEPYLPPTIERKGKRQIWE